MVLQRLLSDSSRIAQVNALDGIVRISDDHEEFADRASAALSAAMSSPMPLSAPERAGSHAEQSPLTAYLRGHVPAQQG